jgi:hypothetical protein
MSVGALALFGGCAFMLLLGVIGYHSRKKRRDDGYNDTPSLIESVMDDISSSDSSSDSGGDSGGGDGK